MNLFIIIVNYGKTSASNIGKVLNELNVPYMITDPTVIPSYTQLNKMTHIILSGGPKHVYEEDEQLPQWIIDIDVPVLAICYGMQLVAYHFGGKVVRAKKEKGLVNVTEIISNKLDKPFLTDHLKWMNRYDQVVIVPSQFTITGLTEHDIACFTDFKKWYCYQYHPEVNCDGIDYDFFINFFKR